MIIRCVLCGGEMECSDDLAEGQHVRCPHCDGKFSYSATMPTENKPKLKVLRPEGQRPASPTPREEVALRRQMLEESVREKEQMRQLIGRGMVAVVVIVAAIVGYVLYDKQTKRVAFEEFRQREAERAERERADAERKESEAKEAAEAERQRKEHERIEAEQEARVKTAREKAAAEAAEKQRELAERESWRKDYAETRDAFAEREGRIWVDADAAVRPDLAKVIDPYVCVFPSYETDRQIYRVMSDSTDGCEVVSLDGVSAPKKIKRDEFEALRKKSPHAVLLKGKVWIYGTGRSGLLYEIPTGDVDFVPAVAEIPNLFRAVSGLGVAFDDVRCRLTLRSKDRKKSFPLGVIGYDDPLDREKIEELVESHLTDKKKKKFARGYGPSKPKLKKFKRTVVFYDGEMIKKDMSGVTHIPRSFEFKGTSHHGYYDAKTVENARRRWESLRAEAERQEQKAREVEAENEQMVSEHEKKLEEQKRKREKSLAVDDDEVSAELKNWLIQVERGRPRD